MPTIEDRVRQQEPNPSPAPPPDPADRGHQTRQLVQICRVPKWVPNSGCLPGIHRTHRTDARTEPLLSGLHRTPWNILWELLIRRFWVRVPGGVREKPQVSGYSSRIWGFVLFGPGCRFGHLGVPDGCPGRVVSILGARIQAKPRSFLVDRKHVVGRGNLVDHQISTRSRRSVRRRKVNDFESIAAVSDEVVVRIVNDPAESVCWPVIAGPG